MARSYINLDAKALMPVAVREMFADEAFSRTATGSSAATEPN
ncbi:hypothetical protein [Microbulbifer sp.]